MKTQTELSTDLVEELILCGHQDITHMSILDALASTGLSLMENTYYNLASEEMLNALGATE